MCVSSKREFMRWSGWLCISIRRAVSWWKYPVGIRRHQLFFAEQTHTKKKPTFRVITASNMEYQSDDAGDLSPPSDDDGSQSESSEDFRGLSDSSDEIDYDDNASEDADGHEEGMQPNRRRLWTTLRTYGTLEQAQAATEMWLDFVYTYDTRYKSRYKYARVYACRSHASCDHCLKITRVSEQEVGFVLMEGGVHGSVLIPGITRRSMPMVLKAEVDSLSHMGWGPAKIRVMLSEKFEDRPELLAAMPTSKQIENRKSYLSRKLADIWNLTNYAAFNAWASELMCTTKEDFDSVQNAVDPAMDSMIILDSFIIDSDDEGTPVSFGVIVSSRRVFRNVEKAATEQGKTLVCATDGTYKLHFGGWTVVDVGTEVVAWSKREYVHRFIPWAYMFVRTGSSSAYQRMFTTVRASAHTFFGIDVDVAFGSLDHSEAIASAFHEVWPRVKLLTCWPHLTRNALKKASLLSKSSVYEAMIKPHLKLLRAARSHLQFLRMSVIITAFWVESGEAAYANWFRSVYLVARWDRWHVNGSGVTGVIPSQQGIEAHHGAIKKTCVPSLHASTIGVMNEILPRILKYDGERLCPATAGQLCEGPVPAAMFLKAQRLTAIVANYAKEPNFRKLHKGKGRRKRLVAIHFNSSRHIVDGHNILGSPVDAGRSKRFEESLEGHVPDGIRAGDVKFELLSLHRVSVKKPGVPQPFELTPIWRFETIKLIRSHFQCTCQTCVKTGWVCSHILGALAITGAINLRTACKTVPIARAPGRPPGPRPALETDAQGRGRAYWKVSSLTRRFLRSPGLPLKWKILDQFDVQVGDEILSMNFVGVVEAVGLVDGLYEWSARFDQGELRQYHVEELAEAVRRAFVLKVQVTGDM